MGRKYPGITDKDIDAQKSADGYVWLSQDGERIHVRVIKFALDSGEIETLITNNKYKRQASWQKSV